VHEEDDNELRYYDGSRLIYARITSNRPSDALNARDRKAAQMEIRGDAKGVGLEVVAMVARLPKP